MSDDKNDPGKLPEGQIPAGVSFESIANLPPDPVSAEILGHAHVAPEVDTVDVSADHQPSIHSDSLAKAQVGLAEPPALKSEEALLTDAVPAMPEVDSTESRIFPEEYYAWTGSNFNIGATEEDYYKNPRIVKEVKDLVDKDRREFTYLPSHLPELVGTTAMNKIKKAIPKSEQGAMYRAAINLGVQNLDHSGNQAAVQGMRRGNRGGSKWDHAITGNGGSKIGLSVPKLADADAPVLAGEAAVFRMYSLMGRGPTIQVPLIHSGFWVSLKAPTNETLINLYEMLDQEKIALGRSTHGLVFSASSSYTARVILQVLKDHIHDSTLVLEGDQNILDHTKILDMDLLLMAWARTIWPKGYNLIRPELTPEGAATAKVISAIVDLARMVWFDGSTLTDWQFSHMAQRASGKMKLDSVQRYQQELAIWQGREVVIQEADEAVGLGSIKVKLRVPSISEYFVSSQRWVDGVVNLVESTITSDGNENIKNQKISTQSRSNIARQYTHWIEKFIIAESDVPAPEDIDKLMDVQSGEDTFNDKFYKAVSEFREDAGFAIVGIPEPNFKEVSPGKRFAKIIPIDPLSHFFNLLASRAAKISTR